MIVAFVQNGQSEAARQLAEQLPRRSGFFNCLRNNIPRIVEHGDSELALLLLGQFQVPDNLPTNTNHSEAESRDYGMFILRSMTNNNYKPQQIFDTLEETNNNEEAFSRLAIGLCQNYIMANKFEEMGEFLKLTEDKLGRFVLLRYIFIRGHSTTAWTRFCHFLTPPPHIFHVFIEWPLIETI